ncbi:MAG: hypothetical protein ACREUU_18585 [Gammaproteobacteria bacterium]
MAEKAKSKPAERRQRIRLMPGAKVLVSRKGSFSEVAAIENMTRESLFFQALGDYQKGTWIELTFPYDPAKGSLGRPRHAEVIRVEDIKGSPKKGVAVKLLNVVLRP